MVLTGRGALLAMPVAFFLGLLVSGWLGWGWLSGAVFVAGSAGAARYTRRSDLLAVAVSPPLLFMCALFVAKLWTSSGGIGSFAGGILLTLAGAAPWLFAGMVATLVIAWLRGLRQCVSDLRRDLSLRDPASGAGQGRRATPE
ncbi:MAG: hypothetical protein J2P32_15960 [Actinobacteria bacterium]|nr:hypothetical protein [Actinomycetota bacterium]